MLKIIFNPLSGKFDYIFVPAAGGLSEDFAYFMGLY